MNQPARAVLRKGEPIKLLDKFPELKRIKTVLSWKEKKTSGKPLDLDVSIFLLDSSGKVPLATVYYDPSTPNENTNLVWSEDPKQGYVQGQQQIPNFVFYGNLSSPGNAVVRTKDETKGGTETATIDLTKIPSNIDKIMFVVTLYMAAENGQNFGQVIDGEINFTNDETGQQLFAIDLDEDHAMDTAVLCFSLYRNNAGTFSVKNISEGHVKGLDFFCGEYGVNL